MHRTTFIIFTVLILLFSFISPPVFAQETFGPICEGGVTCTPSNTPVPSSTPTITPTLVPGAPTFTPIPTNTFTPTPAPPVAGTLGTTMTVLAIGGVFLLTGLGGFAFSKE